jgi:hypothetical protein
MHQYGKARQISILQHLHVYIDYFTASKTTDLSTPTVTLSCLFNMVGIVYIVLVMFLFVLFLFVIVASFKLLILVLALAPTAVATCVLVVNRVRLAVAVLVQLASLQQAVHHVLQTLDKIDLFLISGGGG